MTPKAALFYIWHKYVHETRYDNYHMDMLRISASSKLKNPDSVPRYSDLTDPKRYRIKKQKEDYTVQDVVDMFAGRGKLA